MTGRRTVMLVGSAAMELLEARSLLSSVTGSESLVNQSVGVTQNAVNGGAVAANGSGSVAVWESFGQDAILTWGIMGRLFAADGTASGPEFVVNANFVLSDQRRPRVAMGGDGTFVVVWEGRGLLGLFPGIYAQRFAADGTPIGTEIGVAGSAVLSVTNASVGLDAGGNFVIAYESTDALLSTGVFARRYAADGTAMGAEFVVNVTTAGEQVVPAVAMAADGSFRIAWEGPGSGDGDGGVYVRSYTAAGAATTGEVLVNATTAGTQNGAAVATRPDGGFWLAWQGNGAGDNAGVFVRRFDADAVAIGPETLVNTTTTGTQQSATVVTDQDGDAVVAWSGSGSGDGAGVFVREFAADGTARSATGQMVNSTTAGTQNVPSIAWRGNNRYVVLWNGNGVGDGNGVFSRFMENDAAVVGTTGSALAYTENDGGVAIDPGLTITDADSAMLAGATVAISGDYVPSQDLLTFLNQSGITGTWVSATGVLTLTGLASVAAYQAALRSVMYENTSDAPSTAARIVTFTVTDDAGDDASGNRSVNIAAVNDAPEVVITGTSVGYTENASPIVIDAGLTVGDADHAILTGATVRIATNYVNGQDVLAFVDQAGITGAWDAATGTLTLSGVATLAAYQLTLRSISFVNTSEDPSTLVRTVAFSVSDGLDASAPATRDVDVLAVNDAPMVVTTGTSVPYTENASPMVIDPGVVVNDADHLLLSSAVVRIAENYVSGQDVLGFVNQAGITGTWDAATGALTLSGVATVAAYQLALRSVTYANTSDSPSVLARTVSFFVSDGADTSASATRDVSILAVNDAPTVTTTGSSASYTENASPVVVDPGVVLGDLDHGMLISATVRVTTNYVSGQDLLAFVNQAGITGSWDSATGTLTLSGVASVAAYQLAMRSVTYANTSDDPSSLTRTILFAASDGTDTSSSATRTVDVLAVNDAPTVATSGSTLSYVENDSATPVDPGVKLADVDHAMLVGATVSITGNYAPSQDALAFMNQSGITGSWNALTGVLTLSGTASVAAYRAALRSVTYRNNSEDPSTLTRTVAFQVDDGSDASLAASRQVVITSASDAPVIVTNSVSLAYTENDGPVVVDGTLSVSDVDSATLTGATVLITMGYISGQDMLAFTDQAGISGTWNAASGTLTLTGAASVAAYQAALRSITYQNTSDNPAAGNRGVEFEVSDGGTLSAGAVRQVDVAAVNDAPVVATTGSALVYIENAAATVVDPGVTVSDVDSALVSGARITISGNYVPGEDALAFVDQSGIVGMWDALTGTLTLSGVASAAAYQAALRSVTYANISDAPDTAPRIVEFAVDDGAAWSGAGTRTIAILAMNDAPVVVTSAGAVPFTEGDPATVIDAGLLLSDADDALMSGASVVVIANYALGQDVLSIGVAGGLTVAWSPATGTLTLSGLASVGAYRAALRSITFRNTSENPSTADRTIRFSVTDAQGGSGVADRVVELIAVNDAPQVSTSGGTGLFIEGGAPVVVDAGMLVTDVDSGMLVAALVAITGNYIAGEDALAFTNQSGISGSWNAATGVLTLTGSASRAAYQVALRSVRYFNSSDNPSTLVRTVGVVVSDGVDASGLVTRTIAVAAMNDAPIVIMSGGVATFTENGAPVVVDAAITIAEMDSTALVAAMVAITGNFMPGQDVLTFSAQPGITGTWNAATGVLTLTGNAPLVAYQAAMRSVMYANTSENPATALRTISMVVSDGTDASAPESRQVDVIAIPDPPVLTASIGGITFTESSAPITIDAELALTDGDSATISGATVRIHAGFIAGQDRLIFADHAGITGTWDAITGVLHLTGSASVSNYRDALRSVAYHNPSDAPITAPRVVRFAVVDDSGLSAWADRPLAVVAEHDPPEIITTPGNAVFIENGAPVIIDGGVTVQDSDSVSILQARVTISGNYVHGNDRLMLTGSSGLSSVWDALTGTLLIHGAGTVAEYAAVLASVAFEATGEQPSTLARTIVFEVTDSEGRAGSAVRQIAVMAMPDSPEVEGTPAPLVYVEDSGPRAVEPHVRVTHTDSATLHSATVAITTGYLPNQDVLSFVGYAGLSGAWNAATGVLTISGPGTVSDYQAALRLVAYENTSSAPSGPDRVITFAVTDAFDQTGSASRGVQIVPVNNAPVIGPSSAAVGYSEHNPPVAIDPDIEIIDADSAVLSSARVRVTGGYAAGEDRLTFMDMPGIAGSWDPATGTLLLSGTATVETYVALLRSVRYHNLADAPSGTLRTIEVRITDDGAGTAAASRTVLITPINTAPVVSVAPHAGVWPSGGERAVDADLLLSDADSAQFIGAVVRIAGGYLAGSDRLLIDAPAGIAVMWDEQSGTLTLSGAASIAEYQVALRAVRFQTLAESNDQTGRTIVFEVQDDAEWSNGAASSLHVAAASQDEPDDGPDPAPPDLGVERPPDDESGEGTSPGGGSEGDGSTIPRDSIIIDPISSGSPAQPEVPVAQPPPRDAAVPAETPAETPGDPETAAPQEPETVPTPTGPDKPEVVDKGGKESPGEHRLTPAPGTPAAAPHSQPASDPAAKTPGPAPAGRCVAVVRIGSGARSSRPAEDADPRGRGALSARTTSVVVASASVASALTGAYAVWTIGNVWAARRAARMIGDVWSLDLVVLLKAWERQNPRVRFS